MPKVRGRPSLGDDAKRHSVSFRATPETMTRIDAAIASSGRSLAQEVETIVEDYFRIIERLGGPLISPRVILLAAIMTLAEKRTGKAWTEDYETWVAVNEATQSVITSSQPPLPNQTQIEGALERMEIAIDSVTEVSSKRGDMIPLSQVGSPASNPDLDRARAGLDEAKALLETAREEASSAQAQGKILGNHLVALLSAARP